MTAPPAPAASALVPPAAPPPATTAGTDDGTSLLGDNMPLVGLGALLAALVGALAYYRLRRRGAADGESSYLESRQQADSFFGASGGQRIDTRDSGTTSSSMSYSLSQLDAIGDVDPVAEADVYLAYGRDLQAEEILKEAMRAAPDRLAIRTKLLEVYAKRRDGKGFELLAAQLYGLTGGQGEDWARVQTLGAQIDPDNLLYRPGGRPPAGDAGTDLLHATEPLGASTMPQSVMPQQAGSAPPLPSLSPALPGFLPVGPQSPAAESPLDFELDIDLDMPAPSRPQPLAEPVRPSAAFDASAPSLTTDFDLPLDTLPQPVRPAEVSGGRGADGVTAPTLPAPSSSSNLMDFDLTDLPLDFDLPSPEPAHAPAPAALGGFGAIGFGDIDDAAVAAPVPTAADDGEGGDPFERKIELADEFRQIGDADGARDLLLEVVARASGAQKAKAQRMLDALP